MATTTTTNYNLVKPDYTEDADIAIINGNMDTIDTALGAHDTAIDNRKTKQTAKTDPTAAGNATAFIDSITQDANGEITATKKNVQAMVGATSSANGTGGLTPASPKDGYNTKYLRADGTWVVPPNTTYSQISRGGSAGLAPGLPSGSGTTKYLREDGNWQVPPNTTYSDMSAASATTAGAHGLVPAPAAGDNTKFLRGDKTWAVPTNTTYGKATTSSLGLIQTGYTTNNKNYAVSVDTYGNAYVNVPWTDNNTTYSTATSDTLGLVKIGYSPNGKNYAVQLSSGQMYVNVPWTDTTYTFTNKGATLAWGTTSTVATVGGVDIKVTMPANPNTDAKVTQTATTTNANYEVLFSYTNDNTTRTEGARKANNLYFNPSTGALTATKVYNAVWNDYAECREADTVEPGRCLTETESGVMTETWDRLLPACRISSDTFGSCMGETDKAKTPIAVAGRVLAYPYKGKKLKIGDAVCSAPGGTVDVMTRREIRKYPDRIVGIVSEIPKYDTWEAGSEHDRKIIPVNGRVWIYVR